MLFIAGSSQANCDVTIFDDSLYEDSEEFTLKIVTPSDGAKIGKFSEVSFNFRFNYLRLF